MDCATQACPMPLAFLLYWLAPVGMATSWSTVKAELSVRPASLGVFLAFPSSPSKTTFLRDSAR